MTLLAKRSGSVELAQEEIAAVASALGLSAVQHEDEQMAGLALCAMGERVEVVSSHLSWRDFERFCSNILRARRYRVMENIYLRKPRAQIDVLGISDRLSLAVDCKHWARQPGRSALGRLVEAQRDRAKRLHDSLDSIGSIVPLVLVMADPGVRFVAGGAVVPIFALADFLDNVESYVSYVEPV
ncbi:MAG: restriction endonuclease [Nitrososphaerota archaeon]|nr:restriction endonuclease [Nitrososphaerota archaeon]MDG6955491.1 restriction endonuclease [Nitrososphaerota archaeon]